MNSEVLAGVEIRPRLSGLIGQLQTGRLDPKEKGPAYHSFDADSDTDADLDLKSSSPAKNG